MKTWVGTGVWQMRYHMSFHPLVRKFNTWARWGGLPGQLRHCGFRSATMGGESRSTDEPRSWATLRFLKTWTAS